MNGRDAARLGNISQPARRAWTRGEVFWAVVSLCLVAAYVNTVVVWNWLEASLNTALLSAVPLILALILAAVLVFGRRRSPRMGLLHVMAWVTVAAVCAAFAWLLIDPDFPAKRVHLFEYALLAVVVRQFFRARLAEPMASVAGVVVAAVLGVHDELLQGLHPGRFFSPLDVIVNSLSACAGGALAYAFHPSRTSRPRSRIQPTQWLIIAVSAVMLMAFLHILATFGVGSNLAPSLLLPLSGLLLWFAFARREPLTDGRARFVFITVSLSAAAAISPSLAMLFDVPFA